MFEGNGNKKDVLVKIVQEKNMQIEKLTNLTKIQYVNVCESFNSFI
jgi:hypothetical protein